ncbi:MAG: hypothetical protein IGS03_14020 [Candidatus Sericytochromatia bacterium]|nr:hypothetical protein [Candidatus Sericytochromatia bacterium]
MSVIYPEAHRQAHTLSAMARPDFMPATAPTTPVNLDVLSETVDQKADRIDIANRISSLPDDALRLTDGLSDTLQAMQSLAEAAEHVDDGVRMVDALADLSQKSRLAALVAQSSDESLLWLAQQGGRYSQSLGRIQQTLGKGVQNFQALPGLRWWFKPQVQHTMNHKVFPVINAVGATAMIYTHSHRFAEARASGDTRGQIISGAQLALNLTSGVTGFMPGKGHAISSITGLTSLIMEWTLD